MTIHVNYEKMDDEQRKHVDNMYNLVNEYAKDNGIKLAYNDDAERFVEAIATYIVTSKERLKICPSCGGAIEGAFYALSRKDNKTKICNDCGTREALEDMPS